MEFNSGFKGLNRAATEIGVRRKYSDVKVMFTKHTRNVLSDTEGISTPPANHLPPGAPKHTHF